MVEAPTLPSPASGGGKNSRLTSGGCADLPVSLVALFDQAIDVDRLERAEMAAQGHTRGVGRDAVVVVGAARWLGHDLIRQSEPFQIRACALQPTTRPPLPAHIPPHPPS